jgi:hypothetical protein
VGNTPNGGRGGAKYILTVRELISWGFGFNNHPTTECGVWSVGKFSISGPEEIIMPINLKGIEALIKHERLLTVAIGLGVGIALAIIGYLLHLISSWWGSTYRNRSGETWAGRGARPRWLVEALKKGKKMDDFLIKRRRA